VQGVLDGCHAKKHRRAKHDFAFSGLIACGHCGCSMVAEIKKQRYVYYHCTGYKGKCDEPYVREEVLERQFAELLGRMSFDDEVLDWMRAALHESHADEKREHEAAITRLQAEYDRLQNRIHAMYVDKLDGRVDTAFFERMLAEWRAEQDHCLRCRPVLPRRRRSASRTCTERAAALRKTGASGEATAPQFPGFELLMEGRRTDLHIASTI
jgi:hypothetical protein